MISRWGALLSGVDSQISTDKGAQENVRIKRGIGRLLARFRKSRNDPNWSFDLVGEQGQPSVNTGRSRFA